MLLKEEIPDSHFVQNIVKEGKYILGIVQNDEFGLTKATLNMYLVPVAILGPNSQLYSIQITYQSPC